MEYFSKTKYVRLKNLHSKYLVAGKDGESIKQSRNGNVIRAYWGVELAVDRPNLICLRSCHGKLLTASNEPFLLGWTGDRVFQTSSTESNPSVQWEPVIVSESDQSFYIRLRAPLYGKFLRANGGAPPWRKSVTVDVPGSAVTQDWTMWYVDALAAHGTDIDQCSWPRTPESEELSNSWQDTDRSVSTGCSSPASAASPAPTFKSGIPDLHNAKTIRLLTYKNKYLSAHEDGETVIQAKRGNSKQTYWTVEHITSSVNEWSLVIRLKSSNQKYLTATEDNFLLGATGKKVKQTVPKGLDYAVEWELIRDGKKVKLKTWDGNYLRANGGVPPWRNSVTHDIQNPTKERILWDVEVCNVYDEDQG